jgi:hypothetical protein
MGDASAQQPGVPLVRGLILAESLKPGTAFHGHGMRVTRCSRYAVTGVPSD